MLPGSATSRRRRRRPAADRREGERWTALQAAKNHTIYIAAYAALLLLRPVSVDGLRRLGTGLGRLLFFVGLSPRRVALDNLRRVYPDHPAAPLRALALRSYGTLGGYLGEVVAQLHRPGALPPVPFEDGSREALAAALGEGRGVVFASAHLGPWERVARSLVHHGFPLTTIARESYDARFAPLYERLRGGVGVRAIYRGDATAALRIVRTLRRGGLLGIPMDLRSRVPSVDAPFLGLRASTPVGPARIALRTGAAVVVGTAVRAGDGLAIRVTRVDTADLARGDAGELALTCRLNDTLSARILALPEAWVWMHPRWGSPAPERPGIFQHVPDGQG
jgi:KDO2-lipid IV(A) lauroyltransferase